MAHVISLEVTSGNFYLLYIKKSKIGTSVIEFIIQARANKSLENRLEAINLLLYGLIYAEDYVTQFLDKFVVNILYNLEVRTKEDQVIADKTCQIFYYLGVYCPYTSYMPLIKSALKSEISDKEDYPKYALIALTHLLEGFFETVVKEEGLKARKVVYLINLIVLTYLVIYR